MNDGVPVVVTWLESESCWRGVVQYGPTACCETLAGLHTLLVQMLTSRGYSDVTLKLELRTNEGMALRVRELLRLQEQIEELRQQRHDVLLRLRDLDWLSPADQALLMRLWKSWTVVGD